MGYLLFSFFFSFPPTSLILIVFYMIVIIKMKINVLWEMSDTASLYRVPQTLRTMDRWSRTNKSLRKGLMITLCKSPHPLPLPLPLHTPLLLPLLPLSWFLPVQPPKNDPIKHHDAQQPASAQNERPTKVKSHSDMNETKRVKDGYQNRTQKRAGEPDEPDETHDLVAHFDGHAVARAFSNGTEHKGGTPTSHRIQDGEDEDHQPMVVGVQLGDGLWG